MNIYITENKEEMAIIGKSIVEEKSDIYTPLMLDKIMERIKKEHPNLNEYERQEKMYCSIYDYWVYGNDIDEEYYYKFYEKSHAEKMKYMTNRVRTVYMDYLCCGDARVDTKIRKQRIDLLEMKYECYKLLKPYYKRDVIEITGGGHEDFKNFEQFVLEHPEFVAKPSDFCYGIGVHKVSLSDYESIEDCYNSLLKEGNDITDRHPSRQSSIVLEELIVQCKELASLHEKSINAIRATAVRDKDGNVVVLHPWIKCGVGGQFVASAALNGFDAEIDTNTGIVISDGVSENGKIYKVHPDTGVTIKGFQIPKWDEMKQLVIELMNLIPEYGYVGWDLVLTDDGWVVMEANYSGEFIWQLIRGEGGREEFENIIGWKMDSDYWWQIRPFPVANKKS